MATCRRNICLSETKNVTVTLRKRLTSLLAQLAERYTGIAEVMGSNPVRA